MTGSLAFAELFRVSLHPWAKHAAFNHVKLRNHRILRTLYCTSSARQNFQPAKSIPRPSSKCSHKSCWKACRMLGGSADMAASELQSQRQRTFRTFGGGLLCTPGFQNVPDASSTRCLKRFCMRLEFRGLACDSSITGNSAFLPMRVLMPLKILLRTSLGGTRPCL